MVPRLYGTVWIKRLICFISFGDRFMYRKSWGVYFKYTRYVIFNMLSIDCCWMHKVYETSDGWLIISTKLLWFVSINQSIKFIIQANDRKLCSKLWSKLHSQRWSSKIEGIYVSGNTETVVSYVGRANVNKQQVKGLHNTQ